MDEFQLRDEVRRLREVIAADCLVKEELRSEIRALRFRMEG